MDGSALRRAGSTVRYPASCQLVLAFNPCPCGNMGRDNHVCRCTEVEIQRYWRRVGGALLDRIDMRVPLSPVRPAEMCEPPSPDAAKRSQDTVARAIRIQRERYQGLPFSRNARIPPGMIDRFCPLEGKCAAALTKAAEAHAISSRAFHSVLRMARTIADMDGRAGHPGVPSHGSRTPQALRGQ